MQDQQLQCDDFIKLQFCSVTLSRQSYDDVVMMMQL